MQYRAMTSSSGTWTRSCARPCRPCALRDTGKVRYIGERISVARSRTCGRAGGARHDPDVLPLHPGGKDLTRWLPLFERRALPVFPGVATATDIQAALRHGLETVKFFPAQALGGLSPISALAAPFPGVSFIPTGGIDVSNAPAYLRHPAVSAVGGSWMVPRARIEAGDWDGVAALAAQARALADDHESDR